MDLHWQPTVLVNELYLKLVRIKALPPMKGEGGEKAAFFGLAAHLMKRLLIEHARPLYRQVEKVPIYDDLIPEAAGTETLAGMDAMLSRLGTINPKLRIVVELKVIYRPLAAVLAVLLMPTISWLESRTGIPQGATAKSARGGIGERRWICISSASSWECLLRRA